MPVEQEGVLHFVIHKHRSSRLHYDLRLEIGGVMPSWAVPKGPTLDSKMRRLAMPSGDHTMEYRKFEGVIPKGEVGGGPVMIWDTGTYNPEREIQKGVREEVKSKDEAEKVAKEGLEKGNLKFRLFGAKLHGSFALVRTDGLGRRESWLLIKHRDEFSEEGYDINDQDFSAVSGRSIDQIAGSA